MYPDITLNHQRGVALLTILIMVVLASILALSIIRYQQANLDETKLLLRQNQALQYAQSAEYFLSELLVQDAKDNDIDNLNENWAKPLPVFPIEDGFINGQIIDDHRQFNLNTLLSENGDLNPVAVNFFKEMLKRLNMDQNLVEAVIDWQDNDDETNGAMGAENSYYYGLRKGYIAPNQMFTSVQQLQLVRGFEGENYAKIKPYITVLPSRSTKMNVNTVDSFILSCLSPNLNHVSVDGALLRTRNEMQVLSSFSDIWNIDVFSTVEPTQREQFASLFDVKSSFFTADIQVSLSERTRSIRSWLYRSGQNVQTYQRRWNALSL